MFPQDLQVGESGHFQLQHGARWGGEFFYRNGLVLYSKKGTIGNLNLNDVLFSLL